MRWSLVQERVRIQEQEGGALCVVSRTCSASEVSEARPKLSAARARREQHNQRSTTAGTHMRSTLRNPIDESPLSSLLPLLLLCCTARSRPRLCSAPALVAHPLARQLICIPDCLHPRLLLSGPSALAALLCLSVHSRPTAAQPCSPLSSSLFSRRHG